MDLLHDVADEFGKLVDGVNEDFHKSFDIFEAKIKAAIATRERSSAEMRSNVPAMIDQAVAEHVAQANGKHPSTGGWRAHVVYLGSFKEDKITQDSTRA
jgi:hypothetical protein